MNDKEFFLKEKEIKLQELKTNIEKEELKAVRRKEEIDSYIAALKKQKEDYEVAYNKLKTTPDAEWENAKKDFSENHSDESLLNEIDEKFKEITEKTKSFFNDLSSKVSDFYKKNVEKPKKDSTEE